MIGFQNQIMYRYQIMYRSWIELLLRQIILEW